MVSIGQTRLNHYRNMRKLLISAAAAILLATGCQEETVDPTGQYNGSEFTASTESFAADSKTSMDAGCNVLWSKGDHIAIFEASSSASKYRLVDEFAGASSGSFTLVEQSSGDSNNGGNVAIYPYMENLKCQISDTKYKISGIEVPQAQTYASNSFANGSLLMASYSDNRDFSFWNIFGAIKLQLIGTDKIKEIKIEGHNGEKLSGKAEVTVYSNETDPSIVFADDAATSVSLYCEDGVQLDAYNPTSFYISLPPVTFKEGFSVTITTATNQKTTLKASVENTIGRSSILVMPLKNLGGMKHIEFSESDEIFANPERGFYAAWTDRSSFSLNSNIIASARTNCMTLYYIAFYPTDYMTSKSLPESYLSKIRSTLKTLRDNGAKCILRFAYSNDTDEKPWDPTPEVVLGHIASLKPVLQEYSDVILTLQAGFIGVWGEWYYTDNFVMDPNTTEDHKLRKQVVDAMLSALPEDRTVSLRTPKFKRMMYADSYTDTLTIRTAYNKSPKARISSFNDCFGASDNDYGTFFSEAEREYWKKDSRYTIMGGETCGVSDYCTCNASLKDMEDYHWTYLNSEYNQSVINRWESSGCLNEIKRRLGYRLSLTDVYHSVTSVAGQKFNVRINLENTGFAAPANGRCVELVLMNEDGRKFTYNLSQEVDPRYWFANGKYTIETFLELPEDATGAYTLYLNLPDPKETLKSNPLYSIRLANAQIWDKNTGYNKLFTFVIKPKGSVPEPDQLQDSTSASGEDLYIGNEFNPWR